MAKRGGGPGQGDPEVVRILRDYRKALLAREDAQVQRLAASWLSLEQAMTDRMELLAREIIDAKATGKVITDQLVWRMDRYQRLNAQMEQQIKKWVSDVAVPDVEAEQLAYGLWGFHGAVDAMGATYAAFSPQFDLLPSAALENYVGYLGDGTPLKRLLNEAYPDAVDGVVAGLLDGMALGLGPNQIAAGMAAGMGMGLERITLIARTEQLRVWRSASADQYRASGLEGVQKRLVTQDDRTCMACIVSDGEIIPLDEQLDDHPRGRCTTVFVIKGVNEPVWPQAQAWFEALDPEQQQAMMGAEKWAAWKEGRFSLAELRKTAYSDVWGSSPRVATLAELLKKGGAAGAAGAAGGGDAKVLEALAQKEQGLAAGARAARAALDADQLAAARQLQQDKLALENDQRIAARVAEANAKAAAKAAGGEWRELGEYSVQSAKKDYVPGMFPSEKVLIKDDGFGMLKLDGPGARPGGWGMFRITKGFSAREAAAYNLDEALGLGVVPETSLIESGGKWYSLQNWVDNATLGEDVGRGLLLADQEDAGRVQLLDMIMGNADRHERNWLLTADGRLVAIDNGLSVVSDASAGSYFESHNFARFKNVSAFLDAHKDRLMLSSAYRTKLQKLWKSGELEKILRIATDVNSRVSGPALLQAAMLRASWILDNWDDYFVF